MTGLRHLTSLADLSPNDAVALRLALRHVLWLGGAPDAGKTSVARALAGRYGVQCYHLDATERDHLARATPERQPHLVALRVMTADDLWVRRPPRAMAALTLATSAEKLPMVIADVLALPATPPVLVEGPWLFPEAIAPLLTSPRQALWLAPTRAFKRASAARRDKPTSRHQTSDPARATRHWYARDLLVDGHIRRGVAERRLALLEVDGSRPVEAVAALVAAHFAPLLPWALPDQVRG
ncbi:MAG TPA: hypothetical protein VIG30_14770 [Ktedonobacterales bacterium]